MSEPVRSASIRRDWIYPSGTAGGEDKAAWEAALCATGQAALFRAGEDRDPVRVSLAAKMQLKERQTRAGHYSAFLRAARSRETDGQRLQLERVSMPHWFD